MKWAKDDELHRCPTCKKSFKTVKKRVGNKTYTRNLINIVNNKIQFGLNGVSYTFHYEADTDDQNYDSRHNEEMICYSLTSDTEYVPLDVLKLILDENNGHLFDEENDYNRVIDKIKQQAKDKNLDENIIFLYNVNFSIYIKPTCYSSYGASVTVIFSDNHAYFIDLEMMKK
jgi:hypothetical protein